MDLCAIAAPAGFETMAGLPFGESLIGPSGSEISLAHLASRVHEGLGERLGATKHPVSKGRGRNIANSSSPRPTVLLAVCGAHLAGQPLKYQLTDKGGVFVEATSTAPSYRMFALINDPASRPGLIRHDDGA